MVTLDYRQDIIKAANVRGGFCMTANKKKRREEQHIALITPLPVP
jgi:hypothetical protein